MDARDDSPAFLSHLTVFTFAICVAVSNVLAADRPVDATAGSTQLVGLPTTVESQLDSGKLTTRPTDCLLLEVKFNDRWRVRLVSGKPATTGIKTFSAQTASTLAALPIVSWQRLFNSLPVAAIEDIVAKAEERSGLNLADLNNYHMACVAPRDVKAVLAALNDTRRAEIDVALELPRRGPLPLAPDFTDLTNPSGIAQYYLLAPEFNGLGVMQAWAATGIKGAQVHVTDIEYDFLPNHVEIDGRVSLAGPPPPFLVDNLAFHGTASLGVIGALDNSIDNQGTTGIVPEASLRFYSVRPLHFGQINVAAAVLGGITSEGDVLVIEHQVPRWLGAELNYHTQVGMVPAEWEPAVYDAVRTISALGMIVVAAAGNGSQNLDLILNGPDPVEPLNAPSPDSGAILVGAGWPGIAEINKTLPIGRMRSGSSNFGSRVDVQGWGAGVLAPGYSDVFIDDDFNTAYGFYSGTSSAAAMVAGVVALLQSNFMSMMGFPASAEEMKFLLKVTGQPQVAENHDNIGPLPNAKGALEFLQGTLPAPVFECSACGGVGGASSDFPPPLFDPTPGGQQTVKQITVGVGYGLNPQYTKILFTLDGSEPDALGRDTASGGNGAFVKAGSTVDVLDSQTLRARAVLNFDSNATPDWATTVGPAATLVLSGQPPLPNGTLVKLAPTGNRSLSNTAILFTTNGDDPDDDGLGYAEGGVGYAVAADGAAVALTSSAVIKARSYMRGLCYPDAVDSEQTVCGPGERPRSKVVSGAYSVIDGTVAVPTFSLVNYQTYATGTLLTIAPPADLPNAQIWVTMAPAVDLAPGEPYPNGPHSVLYTGPMLLVPDAGGQRHVQARAYAYTVSAEVQSASEMAWGHYFVTP